MRNIIALDGKRDKQVSEQGQAEVSIFDIPEERMVVSEGAMDRGKQLSEKIDTMLDSTRSLHYSLINDKRDLEQSRSELVQTRKDLEYLENPETITEEDIQSSDFLEYWGEAIKAGIGELGGLTQEEFDYMKDELKSDIQELERKCEALERDISQSEAMIAKESKKVEGIRKALPDLIRTSIQAFAQFSAMDYEAVTLKGNVSIGDLRNGVLSLSFATEFEGGRNSMNMMFVNTNPLDLNDNYPMRAENFIMVRDESGNCQFIGRYVDIFQKAELEGKEVEDYLSEIGIDTKNLAEATTGDRDRFISNRR